MAADPTDLLAQIRQLLDQYLAMGEGTPVSAEAQALASAIDAVGGPAPPAAPMQGPDQGAAAGLVLPPGGAPEAPPSEGYSGGSFDEARSGAKDFLDKKSKKKAKTP